MNIKIDNIILQKVLSLLSKEDEIYLIVKKKKKIIVAIDSGGGQLLKTITKEKNIYLKKDYYKLNLYEFSKNIILPTTKYRTFNQEFIVYKLNIMLDKLSLSIKNNTNPLYLKTFGYYLKTKEFKEYIREQKIKRILDGK